MAEDIRIWEISENEALNEIKKSKLDFESRLEKWIEEDISIISHDLIVIGRQIETDFGGVIDLLCLDSTGDVVIIELKREKTPRDITAQVLDYASWVRDLSNEHISEIANKYLGTNETLDKSFKKKFDEELPEILNESHKMLVVASEIDESTERIIKYLSDSYGAAINAISFQYFKDDNGKEYLARAFLIEPSEVDRKSKTKRASKRQPPLSFEEFEEIAKNNGVGRLFDCVAEELNDIFDTRFTTRSTVGWSGRIGKSRMTIINFLPKESNKKDGLQFYFYINRLSDYLNTEKNKLIKLFPDNLEERELWKGQPQSLHGYFMNLDEINSCIKGLKSMRK